MGNRKDCRKTTQGRATMHAERTASENRISACRTQAKSTNLWERRISIIATGWFIWRDDFPDTLRIAEKLLGDREDLIHKAAGWMLREIGKRDEAVLEEFLAEHCRVMPRTMLRYAIERLPQKKWQGYMGRKMRIPTQ